MKSVVPSFSRRAASTARQAHGQPGGMARRSAGRLFLAGLVAATMAIVVGPSTAFAAIGDWPQFLESQTHQAGNNSETLLSNATVPGLTLGWTGATGGIVDSSPVVDNGVVYVGSSDGKVYAFPVGCGTGGAACTPIWVGPTGGPVSSSPVVIQGAVYVGSSDGKLYAFAIGCATGGGTCSPMWTGSTAGPVNSSPSFDNGVIYVGSNDGKLYAFAAGCGTGGASCTPIWTGATGGSIESSPAVSAAGVVYVGSDDNKLYAFAVGCNSGGGACSPLWTATTGGHVFASPTVWSGVVYVGSLDGNFYAYDAAGIVGCSAGSCSPLWKAVTGGPVYSSASVAQSTIAFGSDDGNVYAFHSGCGTGGATCTPLWTGSIGHAIRSSVANANDVAYVGASDGKVYAFKFDCGTGGATCSPIWSSSIGTDVISSPAISDGAVYIGSSDNKLYAFAITPTYVPLTPARILDSRVGTGLSGAFSSHIARTFQVTGSGGVPAGAVAVTGNLTVTQQSDQGFLYIGPAPVNDPTSSTLNFPVGDDRADAVTVELSATGTLSVTYGAPTLGQTAHVLFDVTGFFQPAGAGATYHSLAPTRILDSRSGVGLSGAFQSRVARTMQVAGVGSVPANAVAITGNLTVTQQTDQGFLYIGPAPADNPTSSNLNFPAGDDRANAVSVALSGAGAVSITYAAGVLGPTAQVLLDVTGYFTADMTGATYVPLAPTRILDTRNGTGLAGTFSSHVARELSTISAVPANAVALTGTLTVTDQTSLGFLYMGPAAANNPTSSNLNFPAGDNRANEVIVAIGTGGKVWITYAAPTSGPTTDVIFDVTGYFVP